jgi:hypothetical protein
MKRMWTVCGCVLLLGLAVVACGPDVETQATVARDAEWAEIQAMDQQLDQARQELAALQQPPAAAAEGEQGGEAPAEDRAQQIEAAKAEVDKLTEQLNERLVTFINDNAPVQGEPLTERQQAAIRMKSDEDMVAAQEYIDRGGDYRRAMKIYTDALAVDPDNEQLQKALAGAEAMRFMTEERFAQAEKGMNRDQVRELLGQPNLRNVREFPDDKVVAWYYPKDERGAAAAVWFRANKSGEMVVYQLQFDAVAAGGDRSDDAA